MGKLFETTEFLDIVKHKDLKWHCLGSSCPSSCCFVPHRSSVVLEEMVELSHLFPILFFVVEQGEEKRREIGLLFKYAEAKNCYYLDPTEGCTLGEKKPLACKQYPFQIVKDQRGINLVMIDRTCPGFSQEQGEQVFTQQNVMNPYFEKNFLHPSKLLVEKTREAQIFTETVFNYNLVVGGKFVYKGIEVPINYVDENRLMELPKEVLKDFKNRGYLRYIYAHLNSLVNLKNLIDAYLKEPKPLTQTDNGKESLFVLSE